MKKSKLTFKKIPKLIARFWSKVYKYVFLLFLLIAVVYGFYILNESVSGSAWTEAEKNEFIMKQDKSVRFNENKFEKAREIITARKQRYMQERTEIKDVFYVE